MSRLRIFVALETLVAAILGLIGIGSRSLWLDEASSVGIAQLSPPDFLRAVVDREVNMSIYHAFLLVWPFTNSDVGARLPSVVFAAACVPFAYAIGRRLAGPGVGLAAGALMAVNPYMIRYAQEARGYALAALLVTIAGYLLLRAMRQDGAGTWVAFGLVGALAAYAHLFAIPVVVAQLLCVPMAPGWRERRRGLLVGAAVVAAGLAPLIVLSRRRGSSGVSWASSQGGPNTVLSAVGDHRALAVALAAVSVALLVAGYVLLLRRMSRSWSRFAWLFAGSWLLLPIVLVAIGGLVSTPLLVSRYFIVCVPGFALLGGLVAAALPSRRVATAALAAVLAVSLLQTARVLHRGEKEAWRGAAAYVEARSRPGDGIVFYAPFVRIPFTTYFRDLPGGTENVTPAWPPGGWDTSLEEFHKEVVVPADLSGYLAGDRRVWLVVSHSHDAGALGSIDASLAREGLVPAATERLPGVDVTEYRRPG